MRWLTSSQCSSYSSGFTKQWRDTQQIVFKTRWNLVRWEAGKPYVYIIDQARVQDGWILAEFSFCVFMDRDEVEVHKNAKRERGQYLAILNELAWSIKDLLYGIKSTEKNHLCTCLFSSTEKETI